jgi:putative phosphoribosyl transferase
MTYASPVSAALRAIVCVPRGAYGLVLIARGSEARRYPGVYHELADSLREQRLATCLVDLVDEFPDKPPTKLTETADMLSRLEQCVVFLRQQSQTVGLPLALVGVDLSAGVAMRFAARHPLLLDAVVSWCGRGRLPARYVEQLKVPTLLLAPGREQRLVEQNNRLFTALECSSQLAIVRGASLTFDEPGAMVAAQLVAGEWCQQFLELAHQHPCRTRCDDH